MEQMNDEELKAEFERKFPALPVCPECGAIEIEVRGECSWRYPGAEDIEKTYKGYREIYGNHIKKDRLCRRCDPNYKGKGEWDGTERRRE